MSVGDIGIDQCALAVSPGADAAGVARRFVAQHSPHLRADTVADAQLVVSELVTNAWRYGTGQIIIELRVTPVSIRLSVADDADEIPAVVNGPIDAESGRGMQIVAAVATAWGITVRVPPPGKTVWAELASSESGLLVTVTEGR